MLPIPLLVELSSPLDVFRTCTVLLNEKVKYIFNYFLYLCRQLAGSSILTLEKAYCRLSISLKNERGATMTEVLMSTGTLPAAPPVVETMVLQASDESEAEIVGETSASDEIPKNDATGELRRIQ